MQGDLDSRANDAVAATIREEIARRRVSRQWLADEARISISTLEKALSGRRPFTLATVVRIEEALGLALRKPAPDASPPSSPTGYAPPELGAYARPAVGWLEGEYLTLRPAFSEAGAVYSYRTAIQWDGERDCLMFHEAARLDSAFAQSGMVSFPHLSGHIYLITIESGQYRMAILSRPAIGGELNGILTTLAVGAGSQLMPAATPITLVPLRPGVEPAFGLIQDGHACYADYRERVDRIAGAGYARLIG